MAWVKKPAQEQERQTVKQTNLKEKWESKWEWDNLFLFISFRGFFFFFSHSPFLSSSLTKHPLPWQAPSLAPFPCLSYVVSERQPSFTPPRELQASVTLSYTRRVKTRRRANGHRSVQNQVKCRRLHPTLLVIVTFEQKLVIWKEEKMA